MFCECKITCVVFDMMWTMLGGSETVLPNNKKIIFTYRVYSSYFELEQCLECKI